MKQIFLAVNDASEMFIKFGCFDRAHHASYPYEMSLRNKTKAACMQAPFRSKGFNDVDEASPVTDELLIEAVMNYDGNFIMHSMFAEVSRE